MIRVFDAIGGGERFSFLAYEPAYKGSVAVAVGDLNGDGYDDIITATATGTGRVRVFDGLTGARFGGVFAELNPFDGKREKGAFVASGDVTGDGRDDLIISSASGGTVKVYDGAIGGLVSTDQPFGAKFRGGIRVAVGDVNGDGRDDIIAGQATQGGRVKTYDGASQTLLHDFTVGARGYRGGVHLAAADLDGDGRADFVIGRNAAPSLVETFSGADGRALASAITPFGTKYRLGARVAVVDVNGDGIADIIAAAGASGQSQVKLYDGRTSALLRAVTVYEASSTVALSVAGSSPVPAVPAAPPVHRPERGK